jgi:hypothetical protein
MTIELVAFIDESMKPLRDRATGKPTSNAFYVVAAAIVLEGDLSCIRAELAEIEKQFGCPIHYGDLGHDRRVEAAEAIVSIAGWDGYLFETSHALSPRHHKEKYVRNKAMKEAFSYLGSEEGVSQAVLETRADPKKGFLALDQDDHEVLQKLLARKEVPSDFRISHQSKSEPVLQLADVLAGARSDFLCGVNQDVYPRIAHRVRSTRKVL